MNKITTKKPIIVNFGYKCGDIFYNPATNDFYILSCYNEYWSAVNLASGFYFTVATKDCVDAVKNLVFFGRDVNMTFSS